ncbi:DUF6464 family protein [Roseofilum sp. BLCC_M154]|uniref:DUF6464 family protein n=1 Tax=Roseofilum acuticapitatum BLCC-M154 TaxID=3022444 RepID=A0ABT7AY26_9CYAN|nr:DUF6464 family protein [Roseofilum acuticapitatum]MDJ1171349.1 DUF6464 family protein [Roseofilum acuticapitatum BLCC-M154]
MNLDLILVFFVGMIPPTLSLWMMRKVELQCQQRHERIIQAYRDQPLPSPRERLLYDEQSSLAPGTGIDTIIGDITCQYNARSPYLRCAINPHGPCQDCSHYEPTQENQDFRGSKS